MMDGVVLRNFVAAVDPGSVTDAPRIAGKARLQCLDIFQPSKENAASRYSSDFLDRFAS